MMIAIGRQSPLADQSETDYSGFGPIDRGHPKRKIELVQEIRRLKNQIRCHCIRHFDTA